MTKSVDVLLEEARARLRRLEPEEARRAVAAGALLVDIRPREQRAREGRIPGAIVVERNVLEWRLDPGGEHCLREIEGHDQHVLLFCSEGYASSLAAAVLQDMGFARATDVIGGFVAWKARGLPVAGTDWPTS